MMQGPGPPLLSLSVLDVGRALALAPLSLERMAVAHLSDCGLATAATERRPRRAAGAFGRHSFLPGLSSYSCIVLPSDSIP
jgi:hypothetical protein